MSSIAAFEKLRKALLEIDALSTANDSLTKLKKMQREQILEHHMDAKSCAKHVVRLIIYDRLEPLIDESEARGFKKRKEKILHNKLLNVHYKNSKSTNRFVLSGINQIR